MEENELQNVLSERMGFDPVDNEPEVKEPEQSEETEQAETEQPEVEQPDVTDELPDEPIAESSDRPQSWSKDKEAIWQQMPKEAKDYVLLREKQIADGFAGSRKNAEVAQAVSQLDQEFGRELGGMDAITAAQRLLTAQRNLTTGSLEQRQQAAVTMLEELGLLGDKAQDPEKFALQQELNELRKREEYFNRVRVEQETEQFFNNPSNKYANIPSVQADMAAYVRAGQSLQQAYESAIWSNAEVRNKMLAEMPGVRTQPTAPPTPRPAKTSATTQEPVGSMRETMEKIIRAAK